MNISLKHKIQRWFEFLRLAHQSTDPVVVANLIASRLLYEPWGDYLNTSFTKWWTSHKDLFRTVSSMRKMTSSDLVSDDALHLVIPYTYAPTTVAKIVQRIYAEEQDRRLGDRNKVKKVYGGSFGLTTDDFQVSQFVYYYRFAKDVYLPLSTGAGKPSTKNYVDLAEKVFANQKLVTSWEETKLARRKVPFKDLGAPYANKSKMARNYLALVQNILRNVSRGEFPGDYLTVSVKNQSEKRKLPPVYPVRSVKRGVSQKRYHEVKKRELPFDMYSTRKPTQDS
jgi:hypothetical protein